MARVEVGLPKPHNLHGYLLMIDGKEVSGFSAHYEYRLRDINAKGVYILSVGTDRLSDIIFNIPIKEISKDFYKISFEKTETIDGLYSINTTLSDGEESRTLDFMFSFIVGEWNKLWTINDLSAELDRILSDNRDEFYTYTGEEDSDFPSITIKIFHDIKDDSHTLGEEKEHCFSLIANAIRQAEANLRAKITENSLVSHFNFPSSISNVCEEYLWSFIQFLKDVGVEATAELKHEQGSAGQVLFSVTPAKGKEMLGRIREALDLYLDLAGTTNLKFDPGASIQVERLEARILGFQSQLRFAKAEAQLQAATIEQQQATIRAQEATALALGVAMNTISSENVFLLSRVGKLEQEKKDRKTFEFFHGLIIIENPKLKGVSVNLSVLLPAVKRVMRGEQAFPATNSPTLPSVDLPSLPPNEPPALPPTDKS